MAKERDTLKHQLAIYGPAALLVLLAFVVAFQFIKPAPPNKVVMATGGPQGAYHAFARRYAAVLARENITLELRNSAGTAENIALLAAGDVDLALVQGGVDVDVDVSSLRSLGAIYYEPLWLFHRKGLDLDRLRGLRGRTVAIGVAGSGTRALVSHLLVDNGLDPAGVNIRDIGGVAAADALISGELDAAFFVTSAQSQLVRRLLEHQDIQLSSLQRAPAYASRYRFLNNLQLPEGVVDLAKNIPDRAVRLLAPAANIAVTGDLHPAIHDLMLQAAESVHGEGGWFEGQGEFPKADLLAFPLSKEATHYYKYGPPFLQRYLPFWAASLVDRLKVMIVPLLMLLLPLVKVMPPIYAWRMNARVYRWYEELVEVDEQMDEAPDGARVVDRDRLLGELNRIEQEVRNISVPLSFAGKLYHLRAHINLVRQKLHTQP